LHVQKLIQVFKKTIPVGLIKEDALTYKLCLVLSCKIFHILSVPWMLHREFQAGPWSFY